MTDKEQTLVELSYHILDRFKDAMIEPTTYADLAHSPVPYMIEYLEILGYSVCKTDSFEGKS